MWVILLIFIIILLVFLCVVINENYIKDVTLIGTIFIFLFSLFFLFQHDFFLGFQNFYIFRWFWHLDITIAVGLDALSLFFVLLTTFIMPIVVLSTWGIIKVELKLFYICLLVIELLLVLAFSALDIFLFYFAFESVLIPMIVVIGIWGERSRKLRALFFFFFYTFIGSIFMLAAIIYINVFFGTTNYIDILYYSPTAFTPTEELFLWIGFFIAFAVKIPMYPFHIWLPEAHVEAPTAGSMILAGLLLKLGGYGFIRFLLGLFPYASCYFSSFVYTLAVVSAIYASCCALVQSDFKKLIAYSSVAHMNVAVLGIFSNSMYGIWGGFVLMLGHGLTSVALFFLVGCLYDRYHSKVMDYYGGLAEVNPIIAFFFFFFVLCNLGFPCSLNFMGEVFILASFYKSNFFVLLSVIFIGILALVYNIFFFERIFFGTVNNNFIKIFMDITKRELFVIVPIFFITICLFLKTSLIANFFTNYYFLYIIL